MSKIMELIDNILHFLFFYPRPVQMFFFAVFVQVLLAGAIFVLYYGHASSLKSESIKKPDPLHQEIVFRLNGILRILKRQSTTMNNEHVTELEYYLSGWYIGGNKEFEGQSTVYLLRQLIDSGEEYVYLSAVTERLREVEDILDKRKGERHAEAPQGMDYKRLNDVTNDLTKAKERLTSGSSATRKKTRALP